VPLKAISSGIDSLALTPRPAHPACDAVPAAAGSAPTALRNPLDVAVSGLGAAESHIERH